MSRQTFNALIAAAGRPRRRGDFMLSDPLGSLSVIRRIIHTFRQAGASEIVVITGYRAKELERHLARSGVICLRNEDWEQSDMMASVRLGLTYLSKSHVPILFTPADIPLFTVSTVKSLLAGRTGYAVPRSGGKCGHPLFLGSGLLPVLLEDRGDGGLQEALKRSGIQGSFVDVPDQGVLYDAELPANCQELIERHRKQPFLPQIHVALERELPFFDKTAAMLLRLTGQTGSVKKACAMAGISYSKGWDIINELELQSGIQAVRRRAGGSDGGATTLTKEGEDFLDRFAAFEAEVLSLSKSCFEKYFPRTED